MMGTQGHKFTTTSIHFFGVFAGRAICCPLCGKVRSAFGILSEASM